MLVWLFRKINQIKDDPVLRSWLLGRLIGKWSRNLHPRCLPPYLTHRIFSDKQKGKLKFRSLEQREPTDTLQVNLAGQKVILSPKKPSNIFDADFDDTEVLLALHRFAWMDGIDDHELASWVGLIFPLWHAKYIASDKDPWVWQPYTASERLIRLAWFCDQHGAPEPTELMQLFLLRHGNKILEGLEYYGEFQTGNHIANNGRGLYLGGLLLGIDEWADTGADILLAEGRRLFGPSGMLREGSSHYHVLVTKWFVECWLAAVEFKRPEESALEEVASKALKAGEIFRMPGGFPLIGDVSPDCTPESLIFLTDPEAEDWQSPLIPGCQHKFSTLRQTSAAHRESLQKEGWVRMDYEPWATILYASPAGWAPQPGHGHRDFGSFELHHGSEKVFLDLGRRSYGQSGDDDLSAESHNTLILSNAEPYPINRLYYEDQFRQSIAGACPVLKRKNGSFAIKTGSFSRLGSNIIWQRCWKFSDEYLEIEDRIDGQGEHAVCRYFQTRQAVSIATKGHSSVTTLGPVQMISDVKPEIIDAHLWTEYGQSIPAKRLTLNTIVTLPWKSTIKIVSVS